MATPTSPHTGARGAARFVLTVAVIHVVTYVLAGLVASTVFDYEAIFTEPVIRDYYLPYASTDPFWSIGLQVLRGALFGLVLLPLRRFLAVTRWGWLWLWPILPVLISLAMTRPRKPPAPGPSTAAPGPG